MIIHPVNGREPPQRGAVDQHRISEHHHGAGEDLVWLQFRQAADQPDAKPARGYARRETQIASQARSKNAIGGIRGR